MGDGVPELSTHGLLDGQLTAPIARDAFPEKSPAPGMQCRKLQFLPAPPGVRASRSARKWGTSTPLPTGTGAARPLNASMIGGCQGVAVLTQGGIA